MGISLADLIKAGLIREGDGLIWKSRNLGEIQLATVMSTGELKTADGKTHRTPSGALRHLNGNKPVDGWLAWKISNTGESLGTLRAKLK
jgi:hypothetical protein